MEPDAPTPRTTNVSIRAVGKFTPPPTPALDQEGDA